MNETDRLIFIDLDARLRSTENSIGLVTQQLAQLVAQQELVNQERRRLMEHLVRVTRGKEVLLEAIGRQVVEKAMREGFVPTVPPEPVGELYRAPLRSPATDWLQQDLSRYYKELEKGTGEAPMTATEVLERNRRS